MMVEPTHQRLRARDLHRATRLGMAGGDDAVLDAERAERVVDLVDDLLPVADDEDAVASRGSVGDDVTEEDGFAAAGRPDVEDALAASREGGADLADAGLLVGAQRDHRLTFSSKAVQVRHGRTTIGSARSRRR